jgi:hypothetical protein
MEVLRFVALLPEIQAVPVVGENHVKAETKAEGIRTSDASGQ